MSKPAMFWHETENGAINCELCHHKCKIPENKPGFCGIRENTGGKLYAASYGLISAIALDPIEKKPLYLFCPGKHILSIGGFGCNLRCPFCQNCDISINYKNEREAQYISPEQIVEIAKNSVADGNIGVAYTYNEPFISYEFLYDCAKLVHDAGLYNILVTNGCVSRKPLENILPYINAMNIDLKSFSEDFYKNIGGSLETVKDTIKLSVKSCHIEITTLIIPRENDSENEITKLSSWLASVDREIPLHLTRFFPCYKYSGRQPTPRETIYNLSETAKKYLKNVFTGNMF